MSSTTSSTTGVRRVRRLRRRTAVTAATLGVVALGTTLALPVQAVAAGGSGVKLSVKAPGVIGAAGGPVEFTETITNNGTGTLRFSLALATESAMGTPPDSFVIDRKDEATGRWAAVPLSVFHDDDGTVRYSGEAHGYSVAAGRSVTVKLRIGAPMGKPHKGATNGGFPGLKLHSAVVDDGEPGPLLAEQVNTIKADSIRPSLSRVPATAVAGGAPIEFDAVLTNPTPSNYVNVGNVLFVDPHATVQVRKVDGSWTTLKKVPTGTSDNPGVYLQGRDSGLTAGKTVVTRVRISYDRNTPLGDTKINPCTFVNESAPFRGTTGCVKGATVKVVAPSKDTSTRTPGAKPAGDVTTAPATASPAPVAPPAAAPTTPAPTASPAAPVTGELATTGASSSIVPAAIAVGLSTLGAGLVVLGRRLRRTS